MTDMNVKIVDAYFNDIAKLNSNANKIKDKLVKDLSDGKIDSEEFKSEKEEFLKKGGTEDDFNKLMENVLGVKDIGKSEFSPTTLNFKDKGNKLEVSNDKSDEVRTFDKAPEQNYNYNTDEAKTASIALLKSAPNAKESGMIVAAGANKVPFITSKDKFGTIKQMQKEIGVKSDGFIGPQTINKFVKMYKDAVANGDKETVAKLSGYAEQLGLNKILGDKEIQGEKVGELLNKKAENLTVPQDNKAVPENTDGQNLTATAKAPPIDDSIEGNPDAKKTITPGPNPVPEVKTESQTSEVDNKVNEFKTILSEKNPDKLFSFIKDLKLDGDNLNKFKSAIEPFKSDIKSLISSSDTNNSQKIKLYFRLNDLIGNIGDLSLTPIKDENKDKINGILGKIVNNSKDKNSLNESLSLLSSLSPDDQGNATLAITKMAMNQFTDLGLTEQQISYLSNLSVSLLN